MEITHPFILALSAAWDKDLVCHPKVWFHRCLLYACEKDAVGQGHTTAGQRSEWSPVSQQGLLPV